VVWVPVLCSHFAISFALPFSFFRYGPSLVRALNGWEGRGRAKCVKFSFCCEVMRLTSSHLFTVPFEIRVECEEGMSIPCALFVSSSFFYSCSLSHPGGRGQWLIYGTSLAFSSIPFSALTLHSSYTSVARGEEETTTTISVVSGLKHRVTLAFEFCRTSSFFLSRGWNSSILTGPTPHHQQTDPLLCQPRLSIASCTAYIDTCRGI